jgi:hypothetical protein
LKAVVLPARVAPPLRAEPLHLYAVYLGGDLADGRLGEDHEVVFVVATDPTDVRRRARAKWTGHGSAHVDAIRRLDAIDGYAVTLEEVGGGDRTQLDNHYEPAEAQAEESSAS